MNMTHGKTTCNQLKAVRKRIAEENNSFMTRYYDTGSK